MVFGSCGWISAGNQFCTGDALQHDCLGGPVLDYAEVLLKQARLDPEVRMKLGRGVLVAHVALHAIFVDASVEMLLGGHCGGHCAFCGFLGGRSGSAGHDEGNGTKRRNLDFL